MTKYDDNNNTNNASRLRKTHELISELNKLNSEVIKSASGGSPFVVSRDPHLRLRRTLTPPSPYKGFSDDEAQFLISTTDSLSLAAAERISLSFSCFGEDFVCDGYFWGACEENATKRIFAVHGSGACISRTRWHPLGDRLTKEDEGIRFCAIDWHSIDRTDKPQDEFLTMLPKHFMDSMDHDELDKIFSGVPNAQRAMMKEWIDKMAEKCPRSHEQGSIILRAMIEQGCGWGTSPEKPFILCIKSWSGTIGMTMIVDAKKERGDNDFHRNISAAVIMHPAYCKVMDMKEVLDFPVVMCWAKDDNKAPYFLSAQYIDAGAVIAGPETGGHANFPEFDNDVSKFIHNLPISS